MRASRIRAPGKAGFQCRAEDQGCLVQVPENRCLYMLRVRGSGFRV